MVRFPSFKGLFSASKNFQLTNRNAIVNRENTLVLLGLRIVAPRAQLASTKDNQEKLRVPRVLRGRNWLITKVQMRLRPALTVQKASTRRPLRTLAFFALRGNGLIVQVPLSTGVMSATKARQGLKTLCLTALHVRLASFSPRKAARLARPVPREHSRRSPTRLLVLPV